MIVNQTLISRMNIWHIPDRIAFSEKPRKKRSIGKCNPTEVTHKINKRTCKVCDLSSPLMYHDGIGCVRSVKDCPTASRLRLVLDCQHFFRQIFSGYFPDIVQAFDTLGRNVYGDDYTSLHNPIVLSSVLLVYGMFHSTQILF